MKKQELREKIKNLKIENFLNNDQEYYVLASHMVSNVLQFPKHISAANIALFASKKESLEINTDGLFAKCIAQGKDVYLPRCVTKSHELDYLKVYDLYRDLEIGAFSLREPKSSIVLENQIDVYQKLDLIYIPGVAFDFFGNRLGFGSGYYDKFIKKLREICPKIPVIGLGFDFQAFDHEIPHNAKDEKVDYIITPTAIFKTSITTKL